MSLKAAIAKPYARMVTAAVMRRAMDPVGTQLRVLRQLLELGEGTYFGRTHGSGQVHDHAGLVQAVPLRDYEGFRPYIDRIIAGESDVLWPGVPLYLCKTREFCRAGCVRFNCQILLLQSTRREPNPAALNFIRISNAWPRNDELQSHSARK